MEAYMKKLLVSLAIAAVLAGSAAQGCNNSKRIYGNCYCAQIAPAATTTIAVVVSVSCAPCQDRDEERCRVGRCGHLPYDRNCKKDKKDKRNN
jgi:outer membrane lipoprotein SlyB